MNLSRRRLLYQLLHLTQLSLLHPHPYSACACSVYSYSAYGYASYGCSAKDHAA